MQLTTKKCPECGTNLRFNAERESREWFCLKCGAEYEHRNFMACLQDHRKPTNLNPAENPPAGNNIENMPTTQDPEEPALQEKTGEKKTMAKKNYGKCEKHGCQCVAIGKCYKCYAEIRKAKKGGTKAPKPSAKAPAERSNQEWGKPPTAITNLVNIFVRQKKIETYLEIIQDFQEKIKALEKECTL